MMRRVKMENGSTKYSDSRKYQVGSFYEDWAHDKWFIILTAEQGKVIGEHGTDKVWLHTMREATTKELETREREQAEWDAKSSDERTETRIESLANQFPSLDW